MELGCRRSPLPRLAPESSRKSFTATSFLGSSTQHPQQLRGAEQEKADALAKLALLVELGVPSELAARIYLAGVRSRAAATELAALDVAFGSSLPEISRKLRNPDFGAEIRPLVSPTTADWLDLMIEDAFPSAPAAHS